MNRRLKNRQYRAPPLFIIVAAFSIIFPGLAGGCGQTPVVRTASAPAVTTVAPYERKPVGFYKGVSEPRAGSWQDLVGDGARLRADNINTVSLSPPVLISQRAGSRPRLILEGEAASASDITDDLHRAGFAVHLAPTTRSPDLKPQVDPTEAVLSQLNEDTLHWAKTAEDRQVEIFSPLSEYNLVLGTQAAAQWSEEILPQVRERYSGLLAAKVVPDIGNPPAAGMPHDFELLSYRGYDYLMLDIFPRGSAFNADTFNTYADDLLKRASLIAHRDGLKGVMVGEFGAWREATAAESGDGPILGAEGQAAMVEQFLKMAMPQVKGVFYQGWTLPGRGARGYPVEEVLKKAFS